MYCFAISSGRSSNPNLCITRLRLCLYTLMVLLKEVEGRKESIIYHNGVSNTTIDTIVLPRTSNIPLFSRDFQQHETFININYQSRIVNNRRTMIYSMCIMYQVLFHTSQHLLSPNSCECSHFKDKGAQVKWLSAKIHNVLWQAGQIFVGRSDNAKSVLFSL